MLIFCQLPSFLSIRRRYFDLKIFTLPNLPKSLYFVILHSEQNSCAYVAVSGKVRFVEPSRLGSRRALTSSPAPLKSKNLMIGGPNPKSITPSCANSRISSHSRRTCSIALGYVVSRCLYNK